MFIFGSILQLTRADVMTGITYLLIQAYKAIPWIREKEQHSPTRLYFIFFSVHVSSDIGWIAPYCTISRFRSRIFPPKDILVTRYSRFHFSGVQVSINRNDKSFNFILNVLRVPIVLLIILFKCQPILSSIFNFDNTDMIDQMKIEEDV